MDVTTSKISPWFLLHFQMKKANLSKTIKIMKGISRLDQEKYNLFLNPFLPYLSAGDALSKIWLSMHASQAGSLFQPYEQDLEIGICSLKN